MSTSTGCAEFAGQRPPTKFPEKPSFSQTCSLLSQYLKEKGSFGNLGLGMTCKTEANGTLAPSRQPTTMNLFPCEVSSKDTQPKYLFPSQNGFPSAPNEDALNKTGSASVNLEPQTAEMTIFYAGQVIVFNDFPADKAKEIMNLASKRNTKDQTSFTSHVNNTPSAFTPNLAERQTESGSSVPCSLNPVPNFGKMLSQEQIQPSSVLITCELPIARRASLHRFLEKRKDRITARAPYQTSGQDKAASKPAESKSWLGLAARSPQ